MILLFGPTGAGKSMQGQMLAARQGWKWLSTGEMLRMDFIRNEFAQHGNGNIGAGQHHHGGQSHADAIYRAGCNRQRRAGSQHQLKSRVIGRDPVQIGRAHV